MKKILVVGATSAIAEACARRWVERGDRVFLVARRDDALQAIIADLRTRGGPLAADGSTADLNDFDRHAALLTQARAAMGGLDALLIAHGSLSDQSACEKSVPMTLQELQTNGTSAIALLALAAQLFEAQGHGSLAAISSVAGDRGRASNYVYGSAKAMLSAYLSGLGQRLSKKGIQVLTIKPGFVDTPMTASLPKGPLWAKPARVAQDIVRAMDSPRRAVLYTPGFWRFIMAIIKHIPESVFRKLSL